MSVIDDETTYSEAFQAVIDWVEGVGGEWGYEAESSTIHFSFSCTNCSYSASAFNRQEGTITLVVIHDLEDQYDELAVFNVVNAVNSEVIFGALVYSSEIQAILWRDSITTETEIIFDASVIEELIDSAMEALELLRHLLADKAAKGSVVTGLEQMTTRGNA